MTIEIEVVDALPGCGKTHAMFTYMVENQEHPWLYLSPMKDEITERVPEELSRTGMQMSLPDYEKGTLAPQVLEFFKDGKNVACTHSLTLQFTQEHIQFLEKKGYNVICDEELDLIEAFPLTTGDFDFLHGENILKKDVDNFGQIEFLRKGMSIDARYGDVKRLADRGCLYGEKNSDTMLVTYLSPDLILSANRFILLTYNFKGSLMDAFLSMKGISNKPLEVPLLNSVEKAKAVVKDLLSIVSSKHIDKFIESQSKYSLSRNWWDSALSTWKYNHSSIRKYLASVPKIHNVPSNLMYFTVPKDHLQKVKCNNVSVSNFVPCNARATNKYQTKELALHGMNVFMNATVKSYLRSYGQEVDEDAYALNQAIQWIFRGCIRKQKPMKVLFLSKRMKMLFTDWLNKS
jgi:hypothetical protein